MSSCRFNFSKKLLASSRKFESNASVYEIVMARQERHQSSKSRRPLGINPKSPLDACSKKLSTSHQQPTDGKCKPELYGGPDSESYCSSKAPSYRWGHFDPNFEIFQTSERVGAQQYFEFWASIGSCLIRSGSAV